jgi:hypothetical protein
VRRMSRIRALVRRSFRATPPLLVQRSFLVSYKSDNGSSEITMSVKGEYGTLTLTLIV